MKSRKRNRPALLPGTVSESAPHLPPSMSTPQLRQTTRWQRTGARPALLQLFHQKAAFRLAVSVCLLQKGRFKRPRQHFRTACAISSAYFAGENAQVRAPLTPLPVEMMRAASLPPFSPHPLNSGHHTAVSFFLFYSRGQWRQRYLQKAALLP